MTAAATEPAASGSVPAAAPAGAGSAVPGRADAGVITTGRGRWVAADWTALPGWSDDSLVLAWPALLRSCERPADQWADTCAAARALQPFEETSVRAFLRSRLRPWRVESADGRAEGLVTGYFEPLIEASRRRTPRFSVPLFGPPADIDTHLPWYTRSQIDSMPAARQALRGREIVWLRDPLDALVIQIQGSGRASVAESSGTSALVRLAYAAHNGQPYQSVARWLIDQGAFSLEQASWPAIKAWARANPTRVREMMHANPRYVFFREEPLTDPSIGPAGAQGVPLTPGRSIAVDKESVPYGTPVWIATTEPQVGSAQRATAPARALQRLVVAQDTGAAITGAVRADYFWGWGQGADDLAGSMKQPLRMWALWPVTATAPVSATPLPASPVRPTPQEARPH